MVGGSEYEETANKRLKPLLLELVTLFLELKTYFPHRETVKNSAKLDLNHSYQQLELDEDTQELLTVNTPRGLYQPTIL